MKFFLPGLQTLAFIASFAIANGQGGVTSDKPARDQAFSNGRLFESDDTLTITLTGNIRDLMNDRSDKPKSHPIILTCNTANGVVDSLLVQAKTRGHFRRSLGDCTYPPLLLEFPGDNPSTSLFNGQKKLKLVVPCQGADFVVREWLAYRLYNLVTPESFRARLVSVELNDTKKKKITPPFHAILLEEDQQLAKRNHQVLVKARLRPGQTDTTSFLKMAVFEYLIGNTDWSVEYQNIKLLAADSFAIPIPVPYDFDHAGLVNAPYAKPADELDMASVRERRYRGYCLADMGRFDEVIACYNRLKTDIYKLFSDCPLLDAKYAKEAQAYLDEFYQTINDPSKLKKEFGYPCDKNGTGNVVIRGLRDDHPAEQQ